MSTIIKISKPIILKYEDREICLPESLKNDIDIFWNKTLEENHNLFNGQDFTIEEIKENEHQIEMLVIKTNYAHYLFDERIGIKEEKYRCYVPWSGILLLTNDDYFVIGEMNNTTSVPNCLQIPGGGIDKLDIDNGIINIEKNMKRELKEEVNLNLEDIDYKILYIECPSYKRHAYGFIAVGKINKSKDELEQHFEKYKNNLIENDLELEFDKLFFLNRASALKELDALDNIKRPYLMDLIKEVTSNFTIF